MSTEYDFGKIIPKFDEILSRGLCSGVGDRDGQMCIEAAICAALDLPHGDEPDCVDSAVRSYKIRLNDSAWSSPQARAAGLRNLGIAQIGSRGIVDSRQFATMLAERTIRQLIPALFRELLGGNANCMIVADRCESEGTQEAADAAAVAAANATNAYAAANACAYAAAANAANAFDAAYAAAADAAYAAAANAANATNAYAAATNAYAAAANAADAAASAYAAYAAAVAASAYAGDKYLILSANIALQILRELGSPGCQFV